MSNLTTWRRTNFALLMFGFLTLFLGQHLLKTSPQKWISILITVIGLGSLILEETHRLSEKVRAKVNALCNRISTRLKISNWQLFTLGAGLTLSLASRAAAGDQPQVHSPLATPLWLGGIALTVIGCWDKDTSRPPRQIPLWEMAGLAGILIASLILRTWGAGERPYVLSGDEGSAGLVSWEFISGERNNLLSIGWFSFPALYFWLISLSQSILGRSIEAIRWVSAVGGALTILALYWTARRMFNRRVALWSAAWLGAFHHHIFFSRVTYNNIWDGLFLILTVGLLWEGFSTNQRKPFLFAGLALGMSQFFYTTSHITPVLILIWLILLTRRRPALEGRRANLTHFALVATSVFLPLALYYAAHPDILFFTASRTSILIPGWTADAAAALGTTSLGLVLEQIWVTAMGFTIAELQGVYYGSGVPLLFDASALLFILGLIIAIIRFRDPRYNLPLLTIIGSIIVGGLSIQAPNAQRMLLLPPMLALMVAWPLEEVLTRFPLQRQRFWSIEVLILTAVLCVALFQNVSFFFKDYLPEERYGSPNGEVTQGMIELLEMDEAFAEVYFVGGENMHVYSIPSLPYLLPHIEGYDLEYPYKMPSNQAQNGGKRLLVILPEVRDARTAIEKQCTDEVLIPRYNRDGQVLFYACEAVQVSEGAPQVP
jgi:4-amino-4-deoxy-L-arabinose transferase-like glycosyltransferase